VPAGRYDRVYVQTPTVLGRGPAGPVPLVSHIEPIVHPLRLAPGETTTVDIELVVRPLPPWSGPGWAAFVASAVTR
jgi:hypothetical protein